jgi:signal transduction histidine kinase
MARYGGSISVRLTAGFMVVLVVFGAALLLTLYHLDQVRRASEEIRVRQEVRRQAVETAQAAQELLLRQREFIDSEPLDLDSEAGFLNVYNRMEETLRSLRSKPLDAPERTYLEDLIGAVTQLRTLFVDEIVPAKIQVDQGAASAETLAALEARSRQTSDRINELSDQLTSFFEIRTQMAEDQARGAWEVSIAAAKIIFPVALLTSLLVVYYTHRSITTPIGALLAGTKTLASGKLDQTIRVEGSSREFQELADSFNTMAGALQANQRSLVEAEKLASVGRLAAGLAHEINNPIAVILGYSQMLAASMPDGAPQKEQLHAIIQEARQCRSIIEGLLDLSRPADVSSGEVINPSEVVTEVINVAHALQLTDGRTVEASVIDRPLPLTVSHAQLRQVTLNIVRNALEAVRDSPNGLLKVEGYIRPRGKLEGDLPKDASQDASSFLMLIFTDNGPGIAPEDLRSLFEPFFTTKPDGMGLGLAISYNIARAHGGFITVQSAPGEGSAFTVGLPLREET